LSELQAAVIMGSAADHNLYIVFGVRRFMPLLTTAGQR
jgi:hypothetical protein